MGVLGDRWIQALSNRRRMGSLFSNDAAVVRMTAGIAPVFCLGYEVPPNTQQ